MAKPDFTELVTRLETLEARKIKLVDLPFGPLKDRLETDWTPNAAALLGVGSITLAMIDGIARGSDSVVWPGGTPFSTVLAINHGLGRVPNIQVTVTSLVGPTPIIMWTDAPTTTSVNVQAHTVDGSSPVAASTADFDWRAEG